jgi:hypothetical protein
MQRFPLLPLAAVAALALPLAAQPNNPSSAERFAKPDEALVARENVAWKRVPIPVPENIVLRGQRHSARARQTPARHHSAW